MSKRRNFVRSLKRDGLAVLKKLEAEDQKQKQNLTLFQRVVRYIRGEHLNNYEIIQDLRVQLKAVGLIPLSPKEQREIDRQKLEATNRLIKQLKSGQVELSTQPQNTSSKTKTGNKNVTT